MKIIYSGIFVTLQKMKGKNKELRGCIGSIAPITLDNMQRYALYRYKLIFDTFIYITL